MTKAEDEDSSHYVPAGTFSSITRALYPYSSLSRTLQNTPSELKSRADCTSEAESHGGELTEMLKCSCRNICIYHPSQCEQFDNSTNENRHIVPLLWSRTSGFVSRAQHFVQTSHLVTPMVPRPRTALSKPVARCLDTASTGDVSHSRVLYDPTENSNGSTRRYS